MRTPETIGEYRLGRELGRGGMGVVFEASREGLPPLALKLLSPGVALDGDSLERFLREGRLLARVEHPNVLRIHDLDRSPVGPYIVTDRIEGESLDALRRTGGLPPRRAVEVVAQIADGVAAIHARGILHRDLKPENVVLRADGVPVLLDFGLARELDGSSLTQTGTVLGTPAYMAPEQAGGEKPDTMTVAVDVYGLGAILFTLLAGRPPHEASALIEILSKVLDEPLRWPPELDVPGPLRRIVERALAKRPKDRFDSAAELGAALRDWLDQEVWRASEPRSVRWTGVVLFVAMLTAIAIGAGLWGASEAPPPAALETPSRSLSLPPDGPAPAPISALDPPPRPAWHLTWPAAERLPWPLPAGVVKGERAREFVNLADGSTLVWVRPGRPWIGGERYPDGTLNRRRRVKLAGFFIGKYEVTQGQYQRFLEATGRGGVNFKRFTQKHPLAPALGVPFVSGAMPYSLWAKARLPTPNEWEYAARGEDGRIYPWGNTPADAPTIKAWRAAFSGAPRFVTELEGGVSPFGCMHMAGNAFEYAFGRARNPPKPNLPESWGVQARGGAFDQNVNWAKTYAIAVAEYDRGQQHSGFRIVVDAE